MRERSTEAPCSAPPLRGSQRVSGARLLADPGRALFRSESARGRSTTSRRRAAAFAAPSAPIRRCSAEAGPAFPERIAEEVAPSSAIRHAPTWRFRTKPFSRSRACGCACGTVPARGLRFTWTATLASRSGLPARRGAVCEGGPLGIAPRHGRRRIRLAGDARSAEERHEGRAGLQTADFVPVTASAPSSTSSSGSPVNPTELRATLALAKELRRQSGFRHSDFLLPPVPGQSDGGRIGRAGLRVSARPRRVGRFRLCRRAGSVDHAGSLARGRTIRVLHAARLEARRMAMAAAGRGAVAVRPRLVPDCRSSCCR